MFAALRRQASPGRDPLEDRCTELLAALVERHEPVATSVMALFSGSGSPSAGSISAETQYTITDDGPASGRRPDLVLELADGRVVWVEVKVDAPETNAQLLAYQKQLLHQSSDHVLATLSRKGASSFPSATGVTAMKSVAHVRWTDLASELLDLAGLGRYIESSVLTDPELTPLQYDVAQFLVYLNQEGVISMTKSVHQSDLELVASAGWIDPISRVIELYRNAVAAAARNAGFDDGWDVQSLPRTKETGGNAYEDDDGNNRIWVWTNYRRVVDNDRYNAKLPFPTVEASLGDQTLGDPSSPHRAMGPQLGIVWGLFLRRSDYKLIDPSDPAVAQAEAVATEFASFEPRYEDYGWRYYGFVSLAEILDSSNQQDALTEILTPKLTALRVAIERHFPA